LSRASLLVLVFSQRSPLPRADRTKPANRYTVETWAARPNMRGSSVFVDGTPSSGTEQDTQGSAGPSTGRSSFVVVAGGGS